MVVAIGLARHAAAIGGYVHWEWPKSIDLRKRRDVQTLLESTGAQAGEGKNTLDI